MLNKLKGMMGFTVQPEYSIYYTCTKNVCSSAYDADGVRHFIYWEQECHVPGSCTNTACDCY